MNYYSLTANWNYPTKIRVGAGRIRELAHACVEQGIHSPLIVTDPGLAGSFLIGQVVQICKAAKLNVGLFCQIKPNPTEQNISDGVASFKIGQHDGIIAFGGGSSIDAAKAIALMVDQDLPLWSFEDIGDNWKRAQEDSMAPVIAIPTTAGSGSEVGRSAVILDSMKQVTRIIFHPNMMPRVAILDPELTLSLPPKLTAATGMDALSHCLEAYCVPTYHPMAEGIAIEGIRIIKNNLLLVYKERSNLEGRTQMLVASSMGASAFQRGLGAIHALAHPLGALYDAHHGLLNAVLMPYVLQANRPAIEVKIARLADYLRIPNGFDGFLDWVLQLRVDLEIPSCLSAIGIKQDNSELISEMAMNDGAAASNPIAFTKEEYENLLKKAIGI